MRTDVIVAHPSRAAIARDIAGSRGLRVELRDSCPPNMVYEVDSSQVVVKSLRSGIVTYPFALDAEAS